MTMLMPSQHASQAFHLQRSRTIFNVVCIPRGLQARCVYGSCPIRVTADEPLQRDLLTTWARPLVVMAAGRWRARAHDGGSDMEPSMLTTMVAAVAAAASALAAAMDRSLSREKACCTCGVRWLRPSELGAACLLFLCVPSWLSVCSVVLCCMCAATPCLSRCGCVCRVAVMCLVRS